MTIIGLLGAFMAKELNVFATRAETMERGFKYLEMREADEKEEAEGSGQ